MQDDPRGVAQPQIASSGPAQAHPTATLGIQTFEVRNVAQIVDFSNGRSVGRANAASDSLGQLECLRVPSEFRVPFPPSAPTAMISVILMVASGDIPTTLCGPGFAMLEHPLAPSSSARAIRRGVAIENIVYLPLKKFGERDLQP
jgi:hypothetical protein